MGEANFINAYEQARKSVVCLSTDTGTSSVDSTGFITQVRGQNYIVTAAHSVLLNRGLWDMEGLIFRDNGSSGCGAYHTTTQLSLPSGVTRILFRYLPTNTPTSVLQLNTPVNPPDAVMYLNSVTIRRDDEVQFSDNFNGDKFKAEWVTDTDLPWTLEKFKGRGWSSAARSGAVGRSGDRVSTLILQLPTGSGSSTEDTTLQFDYKVTCNTGTFIVGYCREEQCSNRVATNIQGYLGTEAHPLRVVGIDGRGDIALCLLSDGTDLNRFPTLQLVANSRQLPVATPVATIGNPLGLNPLSIATGVIRDSQYTLPSAQSVESILTSVSDYAGNSGGPYILLNGQVAGMLTWASNSGDRRASSSLNGGPSATLLRRVIEKLASEIKPETPSVEYQKAYLGLDLAAVDLVVIGQLDLPMTGSKPLVPPGGWVVINIMDDSPMTAQLQPGDVILALAVSGQPKQVMGIFPGQGGPTEVTWFVEPGGKLDLQVLRFDLGVGNWKVINLDGIVVSGFPRTRDVPLGRTLGLVNAEHPHVIVRESGTAVLKKLSMNSCV